MVEVLAARGAPLAEIRKLMPERVMRVLAGRLTDAGAVAEALTAADAKTDLAYEENQPCERRGVLRPRSW